MPQFTYISKDKTGRTMKGEVQAQDRKHALDILRKQELLILKLEEAKAKKALFSSFGSLWKKKIPLDEIVIFTRQLATMTGAGITIIGSLDTMTYQVDNPEFKRVLEDVRDLVNTGSSLSEAMGRHTSVFSAYFVNMIRAGESSGMLDDVLERVALYLEKSNALQKKIQSAMIYPTVVSSMALIITLVMIMKVIPVFKDIFSGFGAALPGPTQFLINISDGLRKYFWLVIIFLIGIVGAIRWQMRTEKGRIALDGLKLKLPIFGILLKKVAISKFSRTLGTLIKSGVPILSALEIVAKTSGNLIVEQAIENVSQSVREGESIAQPMEKSGIFPPIVTRMISVGEKSGELEKMLEKISDFYDEQVDTAVDGLTSMLEPLVIAFLGIVIGGIVLCMFLPIFKMSTLINF